MPGLLLSSRTNACENQPQNPTSATAPSLHTRRTSTPLSFSLPNLNRHTSTSASQSPQSSSPSPSPSQTQPQLQGLGIFNIAPLSNTKSKENRTLDLGEETQSDAECWRKMLALQREYHCYKSARMEAVVEALEAGYLEEDEVPVPSRFCLDLMNEELRAQSEEPQF